MNNTVTVFISKVSKTYLKRNQAVRLYLRWHQAITYECVEIRKTPNLIPRTFSLNQMLKCMRCPTLSWTFR